MWPVTRRIMIGMYDIRPGAASESRAALQSELDWLNSKLSDGRFYLVGDHFSRTCGLRQAKGNASLSWNGTA